MPIQSLLKFACMVCLALCFPCQAKATELLIRYPEGSMAEDFRYAYPVRVLQLALDKTRKEYGSAKAHQVKLPMSTRRIIAELQSGRLDVITHPASRELSKELDPVPFCIRKGILGIRLFLIDEADQARFSAVRSLDELKRLRAGQGNDWLDTQILIKNNFKVVTGASYDSLFDMLMVKRFDYFPRALYEPFAEIRQHKQSLPNLGLEKKLALYYPYPDFFWVRKGNKLLAERLLKGLEIAMADGSFDKLFQEEYKDIIDLAQLHQRRVFRLPNPEIDEIPHPKDPKYWLAEQLLKNPKAGRTANPNRPSRYLASGF